MTILRSGWVALLCFALLAGCKSTHFELVLRPEGDELHRKVTMWSEDGEGDKRHLVEFSLSELQRIATLYDADVPNELVAKHVFERGFSGNTPNDLGGAGWYLHGETSMGALFAYSERFGDDDIATSLRASELSFNRAVDLLLAWLESEFDDEPDFAQFRVFVDEVVRDDLWNLVLYFWGHDLFGAAALPQGQDFSEDELLLDLAVRTTAYLADRGYFDPRLAPKFARAMADSEERENPGPLQDMIARSIATKLGVPADDPLPTPLAAFAGDAGGLIDSFEVFETENDVARQLAEEWAQSGQFDADFEFGDDSVMAELLDRTFLPEFQIFSDGGGGDSLTAILQISVEPLATNGLWDPESGVIWSGTIRGRAKLGKNLPGIFYATWSEPNEAFQNEHFGQVLVHGEALADYWYWHAGLEKDQLKQWDAFMSALEPGPNLEDELRSFCFAGDEARCDGARDSDRSAYDPVNELIWELQPEQE